MEQGIFRAQPPQKETKFNPATDNKQGVSREKDGFFTRLSSSLKQRGSDIVQTLKGAAAGDITPAETGIRVVGDVIGGAGDVVSEGVTSAFRSLPDFIEDPIRKAGVSALQTKAGQEVITALNKSSEAYEKAKTKHPRIAESIEGLFNIASVAPIGKAGQVTSRGLKAGSELVETGASQAIRQAGEAVQPLAKKALTKVDDFAVKRVENSLKIAPSDARRIERPNIANQNPAEWLVERQITGTRPQIIDQLEDLAVSSRQTLDDVLSAVENKFNINNDIPGAGKALEKMTEIFEDTLGNDDIMEVITELKTKADLSLGELNEVKRLMDSTLDLFKVTGEQKAGATKRGLQNIRRELKSFIEDKADEFDLPSVRDINKETQVSKEIAKALAKVENRGVSSKLLQFSDLITGGGVAAFGFTPLSALGIVASKRLLESVAFRTRLAKELRKMSSKQIKQVENAVLKKAPLPNKTKKILQGLVDVATGAAALEMQQ